MPRSAIIRVLLALSVMAAGACGARAPGGGLDAGLDRGAPGDDLLRSRVEQVLASALDVRAAHVSVQAEGGVVTVRGQVLSGFEQQSVGAIVRAVPGVTLVRFVIEVEDPGAGR